MQDEGWSHHYGSHYREHSITESLQTLPHEHMLRQRHGRLATNQRAIYAIDLSCLLYKPRSACSMILEHSHFDCNPDTCSVRIVYAYRSIELFMSLYHNIVAHTRVTCVCTQTLTQTQSCSFPNEFHTKTEETSL